MDDREKMLGEGVLLILGLVQVCLGLDEFRLGFLVTFPISYDEEKRMRKYMVKTLQKSTFFIDHPKLK